MMEKQDSESRNEDLFEASGDLRVDRVSDDARAVLDHCTRWLEEIGRSIYLPIDLLAVLVDRGNPELRRAIAQTARGVDDFPELSETMWALSRRVERNHSGPPKLHASNFSLGLVGLLEDAYAWTHELGRTRLTEDDLCRVVRWRAELQESASVRWAIRMLTQPGDDTLFDRDGILRGQAFDGEFWPHVRRAAELGSRAGMPFLGTPHLMAALCDIPEGILARAAERAHVDPRRLYDELVRIVGTRSPAQPPFALGRRTLTPRLVRMIVDASEIARRAGRPVHETDVVGAFLDDGGSSLDLVRSMGLVPYLRELIGESRDNAGGATRHADPDLGFLNPADGGGGSANPTLDLLGRDLTKEARAGTLPLVHGREEELQRIVNVLLRSEQRNPLLTGEAGVGKTALAAALAQRICDGRVPARLADMRVVEINGASLIGGTSYRGELEARIKALLQEAEDDVILFIDEAHAVFAPRSSSGQPAEVPNHFKAALASGKIAVVAATTEAEYHRWIEQDPALRRRFERIEITELSSELTRGILAHLAPEFEATYEVPVSPEAVDAAIDMSTRFMPEQSLPDKAKKLLMDAVIAVSSDMAMQSAAAQQSQSADALGHTPNKRVVGRLDVALQVAQKTGIPVDRIARGGVGWWSGLSDRLRRHVVGQDNAVERLSRSLVAGRLNAAGRRRPQGVFVFAGPPGVGKGALAGAMAEEIFGSRRALLQLDMGDFQEAHAISRLIGSPPGYVGYQDEDALVTPLRRRPSSIVLLKDFDLAHARVQERFVRLFEEGEIADTRGLRADASHAIFVITINADLCAKMTIGFGNNERGDADETLLRAIAPELDDRLRGYAFEFIPFRGMSRDDAGLADDMVRARLEEFVETIFEQYHIHVTVHEDTVQAVIERVQALRDVREVDRAFRELIVDPVSDRLLRGVTASEITIGTSRAVERV